MKKFGKNCKFCAKVKAHGTNQGVKRYGQCRPHALLQSYHDNPCVNCPHESCETSYSEICKKGWFVQMTGLSQNFEQDGIVYGNPIESIVKRWWGFHYVAENGNSAYIVFGKVLKYTYYKSIRNN